ncbi:bifunctional 2-polyprenyl-6-hydroxyphenol methylase/3-demethylubiquinol 3-O-methyltransferase UbiG [Roseomonas marmotae]|uniref:Ubiquinone biosynthesis O-methyltransferase n=1 Tax=Roseomonas marmotae TaxID=2768161 RepID=A0ABS3KH06_9PROT|nr:bifunctional 2-polyprenyl-6-hydroxyphenol methylase/3-demethylubiquinol 3-O-methyltransferase UbiG [Roseomonas marmotae]MBO1076750.1 bifunctional 2-polyprenyl-6-hydroxyphenol methylase/3-demethylubiquinol 3-O-methyltransferase UbiG [Roseomonas marmotae]QTI77994.1 bifunctional 2-polyprenyl-6-hydroxyphenol methylase/3-demethylubiquinol 3-O-methyltransferase UbiG [Roseomonas marmotae]
MTDITHATATPEEIAKFDALAAEWWDPQGPMAPLHAMNPLRCGWIAQHLARARGGDPARLGGLTLLDVGCGAGLAAEGMAHLGAKVTGLDAAPAALAAARAHAAAEGLEIDYREGMPEALAAEGARFDAVMALEVIEHVADRAAFLAALAKLTKPGGMVFLSTLNRTARSFLFAKLGAEYLLRLLPRGTHDWKMFVTPAELGAEARRAGLRVVAISGMAPQGAPGRAWRATPDVAVNYIVALARD